MQRDGEKMVCPIVERNIWLIRLCPLCAVGWTAIYHGITGSKLGIAGAIYSGGIFISEKYVCGQKKNQRKWARAY